MKNIAFIPVRGGSKSIPLKNIKTMYEKPLVYWTMKAAAECSQIEKVYIATENDEIRRVVEEVIEKEGILGKVEVIGRSAESAEDTASTEFVMLEFAEKYDFENIVLVQATSPLLMSCDLEQGFDFFYEPGVDSVISVVRQKRFHWSVNENGFSQATNYDIFYRPRRQDFEGYLVENGAFYITSKERLIKTRNRISGNIKSVIMPEITFFEIDEEDDWNIVEGLLKKREKNCIYQ